ncbi:GntR family transcriptional regulator [Pleionea sediminis]|uniref:GntR family transcriptional regulator n=1 Tax=Pleionea sediminis TaxID=2569479 RepID=UPI00197BCFC4|nr:GntR family transcriptional regulator [Pleionea sediminis]
MYLQIIQQIKQMIAVERLLPNQELPPIRVLAEQLLINPNTVARAYRELEHEGWVYKKRGAGTFVSESHTTMSEEVCRKQLQERIDALLAEADHMNIDVEQLVSMLQQRALDKAKEES